MDATLALGKGFIVFTVTVCQAIEHVVAVSQAAVCSVNLQCWWKIDNLLTYSSFVEGFVRKHWPRICEIFQFWKLSL